jgi:deazaflavin-dependent oxidoreductase (nitroreductase family)
MANVQRTMMPVAGRLNTRLYRWSGGRLMGKMAGVRVLLLTVAGRNTGVEHTTAVSYFEDAGSYVVTGSGGGSVADPQWFQNLRYADRAVIEVGPKRVEVSVTIAGPEERKVLWAELIVIAPAFARYETKVERGIPMAVLTPAPVQG